MSDFIRWVRSKLSPGTSSSAPETAPNPTGRPTRVPWHKRTDPSEGEADINWDERKARYPNAPNIEGPARGESFASGNIAGRQRKLGDAADLQRAAIGRPASRGFSPPSTPPGPPVEFSGSKFDPKRIAVRVRLTMKTDNATDLVLYNLKGLLNNPQVFQQMMRKAVAQSYLTRVTQRFLQNVEKSLEMRTSEFNGRQVALSPQTRLQDLKNKERLRETLAAFNEANLDGNVAEAERLRKRADRLADVIGNRLQYRPGGRAKIDPHPLSTARGVGQFRKALYGLLGLLNDILAAQVVSTPNSVGVFIGNLEMLDKIETPSSTYALTGVPTRSRLKTFWRHIEFGTGIYRKDSKLNPDVGPKSNWWYGPRRQLGRRLGIMAEGSHPMNFLTNAQGTLDTQDVDALTAAITGELTKLLNPLK